MNLQISKQASSSVALSNSYNITVPTYTYRHN